MKKLTKTQKRKNLKDAEKLAVHMNKALAAFCDPVTTKSKEEVTPLDKDGRVKIVHLQSVVLGAGFKLKRQNANAFYVESKFWEGVKSFRGDWHTVLEACYTLLSLDP